MQWMYFRYIFNKYLPLDEGVVVHLNFNPLFPWIICVKFGLNLAMCIRINSRKEEKIKSFQIVKRTDSRRSKKLLDQLSNKGPTLPLFNTALYDVIYYGSKKKKNFICYYS